MTINRLNFPNLPKEIKEIRDTEEKWDTLEGPSPSQRVSYSYSTNLESAITKEILSHLINQVANIKLPSSIYESIESVLPRQERQEFEIKRLKDRIQTLESEINKLKDLLYEGEKAEERMRKAIELLEGDDEIVEIKGTLFELPYEEFERLSNIDE